MKNKETCTDGRWIHEISSAQASLARISRTTLFAALVLATFLMCSAPAQAHLGDFRVTTWNSLGSSAGQKWKSVLGFLQRGSDVVLIQEAGNPVGAPSGQTWPNPDDATRPLTHYAWSEGGSVYHIYYLQGTKNLAIVTPYYTDTAVVLAAPDNNNGSAATRGIPGVQLQNPFVQGGTPTWFFSAHASSFGPNNAYNNAEGILDAVATRGYTSWVLGGDFNRNLLGPEQFWPTLPSTDVISYHANQPTHQGGGELDYLFSNDQIDGEDVRRMGNPGSDHWPVCVVSTRP